MNQLTRRTAVMLLAAVSLPFTGCENAGQGAVSGAGIGALSGLAIGSLSGNAGKGAVIGAVAGGVGGAVIGDQNRRRREEAYAPPPPPPPPALPPPSVEPTVIYQQTAVTTTALARFNGEYRIAGAIDGGNDVQYIVKGTARCSTDKPYYARIDVHFKDPRTSQPVDGSIVIAEKGGRAMQMTSSFSSSPEVREFQGQRDDSGNVMTFDQVGHSKGTRRVIIRLTAQRGFAADVWIGNRRMETYTFSS